MEYRMFGDTALLRLDLGDEVLDRLAEVCRRENIRLGTVSGLGAVDKATIGLYEVPTRQYHATELDGEYEISALTGNVTRKGDEVYLHLHAVFSGAGGESFGGHLTSAHICATGEIFIHRLEGEVGRAICPDTGLNIMKF